MISEAASAAFERIRSGESKGQALEDDWEAVYRAIWPILVARASRRGLSQFAPDIVQSALLSILERQDVIAGFITIDHFLAYASKVVANRAIDNLRRLLRLQQWDPETQDPPDPRINHDDPMLMAALRHLSSGQHDLLRMFYIEGRTYGEIAEIDNTTEREIRTRMFELQKELSRLGHEKSK
jgi:RNA polymerase sigma factor (sigma-70 family)